MLPTKSIKLAAICVPLVLGAGAVTYAGMARGQQGLLPEGTRVAGLALGGRTLEAARAELETWRKDQLRRPLELEVAPESGVKRRWKPIRASLGAAIDVNGPLGQAEAACQDAGLLARAKAMFSSPNPPNLAAEWKVDATRLRAYLTRHVAPSARHEPRDARFLPTATGFKVIPDRPGTTLDIDAAAAAVTQRISDASSEPVVLPVKAEPAHVAAADLQGIEGEISQFHTSYGERGNRARNIEVACSHINGTVLKPGDVFSYNRIVGPRDEDAGFHMAPVIIRGKLKPGMGGGVCQVSSTLYNAALLADLKIVQRTHHAFPVHYLPAGRDATVAYGSIDFQFANDTDSPVAIGAGGKGGRVLMRIFGKPMADRKVSIERTNVSSWGPGVELSHDSSLPSGTRRVEDAGHAGHRVTVWRTVRSGDQVVKREMISRDYYQAFPRVVVVGRAGAAPRSTAVAPSKPALPVPPHTPSAPPGSDDSGPPPAVRP